MYNKSYGISDELADKLKNYLDHLTDDDLAQLEKVFRTEIYLGDLFAEVENSFEAFKILGLDNDFNKKNDDDDDFDDDD